MSKNIAIVGTGNAAQTHIETYKKMPNINVKWVVSRSIEQAEKFCKKMGVGTATESLDDVLKDSETHIVDIISLPHLHLDQARKALDSGKDVFIEKPISINLEDASRFYNDYYQSSQGILVIYQYPYSETFQKLGKLVCSNRFGALKAYRLTYFSKRTSDYYETWTSDPTQAGGGVLINNGIHFINLIMKFIGYSNMKVFASSLNVTHEMKVEDTIFIQTTHEDGVIGTFNFSTAMPSQMSIEFFFEKEVVWTKGGKIFIEGETSDEIPTPRKGTLKDLIEDYMSKNAQNRNLKMNFHESIMDLAIVSSCYDSHLKSKAVTFNSC